VDGGELFNLVAPYVFGGGGWVALAKIYLDGRTAGQQRAATASRERTDLVKIAQEAAGEVIEDLRSENKRVRDRLADIEREFGAFRRAHDVMVADKDAKIALLEGTIRMKDAELEGLRDVIRRAGLPLPLQGQPYWEMRDGRLEPIQQEPLPS